MATKTKEATKTASPKADKIREFREESHALGRGKISKTKQDNIDRIASLKGNKKNRIKK